MIRDVNLLNWFELVEYAGSLQASNFRKRANFVGNGPVSEPKRSERTLTARNKPVVSAQLLERRVHIGQRLLDRIGNTPLIRLQAASAEFPNIDFCAKAEWFNPGGSVKDRAACSMIREGERQGALRPGKIILDATSGNTGIAYAMIGAALGYRVKLCLPTSASAERKQILQAYGVDIVFTPGDEGTDGAIRRVREIYDADPDKYFYPESIWKPRESGSALLRHRSGDLGPDAREDHAFCRRPWNKRNFRGHHSTAEGTEFAHALHQYAAGFELPRPRRTQAHGDRDCAVHLRFEAGGRKPLRDHRRCSRDGEATGARRGHSCRG